MKWTNGRIACAIFAGVFLLMLAIDGNRLLPGTNDEGIYLDAAERMLHGQKLYVDFFGYMTPGVFWVQELSFRLFGVTQLAGRVPVLLYFSVECALLFWLVARLASRGAALLTLLVFFSIQAADLSFITAQHRWDSGALALASMAFAVHGLFAQTKPPWIAAGALAALAAFFTPSMALLAAATALFLMTQRAFAIPYIAGCALASLAVMAAVAAQGIFSGLLGQIRWLSHNYSDVNVMPYGAVIGGYGKLLEGHNPVQVFVVFFLALPAILPVLNLAGWPAALTQRKGPYRRVIVYLLLCMLALVASTYPRPDLAHLAWIAPLGFALAATLISNAAKWIQATVIVIAILGAALLLMYLAGTLGGVPLNSPVGPVRIAQDSAPAFQRLLDLVKPDDTAFVHPYKPLLYFVTQTRNPTRYSYAQPDLMGDPEEQSMLDDLRRAPPQWVLLLHLTPEEFLRVFPSADISKLRFNHLEDWIEGNYAPVDPPLEVTGYQLLRRN